MNYKENVTLTELSTADGRKSFYGKAYTVIVDGVRYLKSYNTIVAGQTPDGIIHRYRYGWSATTGRHLNAAFGINKKAWDKLPVESIARNIKSEIFEVIK